MFGWELPLIYLASVQAALVLYGLMSSARWGRAARLTVLLSAKGDQQKCHDEQLCRIVELHPCASPITEEGHCPRC
jgi:hypothetical protein